MGKYWTVIDKNNYKRFFNKIGKSDKLLRKSRTKEKCNENGKSRTKEKCIESASKFKTRKEWVLKDYNAYKIALECDWLVECINHMKWTKEKCIESALKFKTRKEWQKNDFRAYNAAHRHGWLDECCIHMKYLLKEKCIEFALKYKTRGEWQKSADRKFYDTARKHGWFEECCSHMTSVYQCWTKEMCKEIALKYETKEEWKLNQPAAFIAAKRHGWFDECCSHMKKISKNYLQTKKHIEKKHKIFWTKERCVTNALKYRTRMEWKNNERGAYEAALKYDWIEECCVHMQINKKCHYLKKP